MQLRIRILVLILPVFFAGSAFGQIINGHRSYGYPNDPSTGTVQYGTAVVNSSGNAISATTAASGKVYIVGEGAGTTGTAGLAWGGVAPCIMDSSTSSSAGSYVFNSSTTNGSCHAQTAPPACGSWVIGTLVDNSTAMGQTARVAVSPFIYSCGGSGSGTVNAALQHQVALYAANGTAVSGDANLTENGTTLNYSGNINATGAGSFGAAGPYATLIASYPCASNAGAIAQVTDSTTNVPGQMIAGGGSFDVLAFCNGANYIVAAGAGAVVAGPFTACQTVVGSIATGLTSSGLVCDTTQFTGANIVARWQSCIGYLTGTGGICNMEAEPAATTNAAVSSSVSNITTWLPPAGITLGASDSWTLSGAHVHLICRGGKDCPIVGAAVATTNAIDFTGINSSIEGSHYEGGRCGTIACAASTVTGGAQTENGIAMSGTGDESIGNLIEDSGKIGVEFVNCDECKSINDRVNRAGAAGIYVNATTGVTQDGVIDGCVVQDSDTTGLSSGEIGFASSGGLGLNSGWTAKNCTVKNLVFTTGTANICNGLLTTAATGCKQGIQVTDNVYNWHIEGNNVYSTQNEGIASSGYSGTIIGNHVDAGGLLGAGAGGIMASYSTALSGTIGGITIANNVVTNSSTITPSYGISIQFELNTGANDFALNYDSINVSGNCIDDTSGTGGYVAALRFFNSSNSGNSVTLNNVGFHNPCITLVNGGTPVLMTYSSNTTGAVTLDDGLADPAPVYASGCSTGTPTIAGSFHSFRLTIGATPATTCTLTMPRSATGWWIGCADVTSKTNGGYLTQLISDTTTSVVIGGYNTSGSATAWNASDVLQCKAEQQ